MSDHNDQGLTKYRCENHLYFVRLFFYAVYKKRDNFIFKKRISK